MALGIGVNATLAMWFALVTCNQCTIRTLASDTYDVFWFKMEFPSYTCDVVHGSAHIRCVRACVVERAGGAAGPAEVLGPAE
jgi:hypothetical protein